jgi:hypothetical protein
LRGVKFGYNAALAALVSQLGANDSVRYKVMSAVIEKQLDKPAFVGGLQKLQAVLTPETLSLAAPCRATGTRTQDM